MHIGERVGLSRAAMAPLVVAMLWLTGCAPAKPDTPPPVDHAAMAHSDHTPKFGGLVLMERDIHFEVVAQATGHYRVYFSDDRRNPLPASTVKDAVITVMRPEAEAEVVALKPDDADQSWIGESRPVDSDDTMVRVSYVYRAQPYWIDLPFIGFKKTGATAPPSGSR